MGENAAIEVGPGEAGAGGSGSGASGSGQATEDATDLKPTTAHTGRVVVLGGTAILLLTGGLWLWARSGFATPPELFMTTAAMLALAASTATQTGGGLIIAVRRPGNMVGWAILLFACAIGLTVFVHGRPRRTDPGRARRVGPATGRACRCRGDRPGRRCRQLTRASPAAGRLTPGPAAPRSRGEAAVR